MDEPIFSVTIPVQYHASKKNNKEVYFNAKTGKRFIGSNSRVKKAEDLLLLFLRQRAIDMGLQKPISGRLFGVFQFYFPRDVFFTASLTESKRMGDCSNIVQAVEDALQKAEIIEDDFQLGKITVERLCGQSHAVKIDLYEMPSINLQLSLETK